MSKSVSSLNKTLNNDAQWQAFIKTDAIVEPVTMGVQSAGGEDDAVLVSVGPHGSTSVTTGPGEKADFVLSAKPEQVPTCHMLLPYVDIR